MSGLRGLVRGGRLAADDGEARWRATESAAIERVPLRALGDLWPVAASVAAYAAPYVALAIRDVPPLLTADARLARGAGRLCDVRLVAA